MPLLKRSWYDDKPHWEPKPGKTDSATAHYTCVVGRRGCPAFAKSTAGR
jgi:hypothetical protein